MVLDGFITTAAALVAWRLAPLSVDAMIAGHLSPEPGHAVQLEALELEPVLTLRMRLGEGSGAVLALPIVSAAVRVLHEVATFDSAGVTEKPEAVTETSAGVTEKPVAVTETSAGVTEKPVAGTETSAGVAGKSETAAGVSEK